LLAIELVVAFVVIAAINPGEAHKPITSPYTFTEDVLPILKDHCGRCHVNGGVAPMSLFTHEETVPWGESIRMELIAGHMPPWDAETAPSRFRDARALTARELNVLLTWAAGGTPRGSEPPAPPATADRSWPLGEPDVVLEPEAPFTLEANAQERTQEFTLRPGNRAERWLRAIDLMPGTAAIVRSATIAIRTPAPRNGDGLSTERLLALWLPGDATVPLDRGNGFRLPAGAEIVLRVRYRKTWQHERDAVTDLSRVGLYFVRGSAADVQALTLAPSTSEVAAARTSGRLVFTRTLAEDFAALAIYPATGNSPRVTVHAVHRNEVRDELIAFRPQRNWLRRYWFRDPVFLPRGTRIEVTATTGADESALLPPGALSGPPGDLGDVGVTLNLVKP
jgi:hypothetical protein